MSGATGIEWTDRTWNPVTGCTKVSAGCKFCYAEVVAGRFWHHQYPPVPLGPIRPDGAPLASRARHFTDVQTHAERLLEPLRWRKPARVFVNSMSDLFHEAVPFGFVDRVFAVMALAPRHTFQILTKRPARMREYLTAANAVERIADLIGFGTVAPTMPHELRSVTANRMLHPTRFSAEHWAPRNWPLRNIWLGVSVEDQAAADARIPVLIETPAAVRFASYEPALGPVDFEAVPIPAPGAIFYGLRGVLQPTSEKDAEPDDWKYWTRRAACLDWVIVGGESGAVARPFDLAWARAAVAQCRAAGVPVFVKQLGANPIWRLTNGLQVNSGANAGESRRCGGVSDPKGGDPAEWPEDLRVREFPGGPR